MSWFAGIQCYQILIFNNFYSKMSHTRLSNIEKLLFNSRIKLASLQFLKKIGISIGIQLLAQVNIWIKCKFVSRKSWSAKMFNDRKCITNAIIRYLPLPLTHPRKFNNLYCLLANRFLLETNLYISYISATDFLFSFAQIILMDSIKSSSGSIIFFWNVEAKNVVLDGCGQKLKN